MKLSIALGLILLSHASLAKEVMGRKYFNEFLGHVHKNPARDSASLTIVQCQHSVKLLSNDSTPDGWAYVQVGEDKGYIELRFLSTNRPPCFQEKYPKFYQIFNLDLSEMYFWGKLSDHYLQGRTQAK
ncbi:MAG: hypothetical protein CME65_02115 [Halobacteriovoraceae bacterium]|nr:hypothetical protein [Halobacteriovoraceae bacterium]|tara:strand:- start:12249 stop:12632 length:384 start_codon:yes stop_codon:yes gene_type:complete